MSSRAVPRVVICVENWSGGVANNKIAISRLSSRVASLRLYIASGLAVQYCNFCRSRPPSCNCPDALCVLTLHHETDRRAHPPSSLQHLSRVAMSETAPTHATAAVSEHAAAPSPPAAAPAPASEHGSTAAAPTAATMSVPPADKSEAPPKEAVASAAPKDNAAASKPSVIEQVKRYIPGLGTKDEPAKTSKRKKSGKKPSSTAADVARAKDPALATATLETAPSREELPKELQASGGKPRIAGLSGTPVEDEADTKKFSAAAYVQKRLRTNNKKIVSFVLDCARRHGMECLMKQTALKGIPARVRHGY